MRKFLLFLVLFLGACASDPPPQQSWLDQSWEQPRVCYCEVTGGGPHHHYTGPCEVWGENRRFITHNWYCEGECGLDNSSTLSLKRVDQAGGRVVEHRAVEKQE